MYMGQTVHKLVPAVWGFHNGGVTGDVLAPLDLFTHTWPRNHVLSMWPLLPSTKEDHWKSYFTIPFLFTNHPKLLIEDLFLKYGTCSCLAVGETFQEPWFRWWPVAADLHLDGNTLDVQGSDSVQWHGVRKQTRQSAKFSLSSGHRQPDSLWSRLPFQRFLLVIISSSCTVLITFLRSSVSRKFLASRCPASRGGGRGTAALQLLHLIVICCSVFTQR